MYSYAVYDVKLLLLAFEVRWHFVEILCLKAMGTLDSDAPLMERRVALKLGLQLPQLDEVKRRLLEIGLIDEDFQPISWDERQYESDISTERVRRYRMKRGGNVSETPSEQSRAETEQSRAEQREDAPAVAGLDVQAWTAWTVYRKQIGKPVKPASIPAAQRKLAAYGTSQAAIVEQSVANGWQGLFPLKSAGEQQQTTTRKTRYEQLAHRGS
jgi:hypothetical protein